MKKMNKQVIEMNNQRDVEGKEKVYIDTQDDSSDEYINRSFVSTQ